MAFSHRGIGDNDPGSRFLAAALLTTLRWAAIPCLGIALALWSAATLAGLHSAASLAYAGTLAPSAPSLSIEAQLRQLPKPATPEMGGKGMPAATGERPVRLAALPVQQARQKRIATARPLPADPFGKVVLDAKLSREKLLDAFARAGMAIEEAGPAEARPVQVALVMPLTERFHRAIDEAASSQGDVATLSDTAVLDPLSPLALGTIGLDVELAYAAAGASPDGPVELALASLALDPYGMDGDETESGADIMPDAVEPPPATPEAKPGRKPARSDRQEPQALAYARPDKPEGTVGRAFRNLFNTVPKAGNKVAIYDISAAVVYMPDGSRLEAHSGIGKMADNPRYVHVKMNGPTPPNTYKLTMREKRFHGVEAIRMTPIGNQTMHGRDGMLAHSYLLRGGRAESHGCVAFANYPKFLEAFKQGKVTHMIVVPSVSRADVRMVSNDRG
ncbi:MAG TPA: DUF2778 domain-containing protein [Rhizobiaceae bacterium]